MGNNLNKNIQQFVLKKENFFVYVEKEETKLDAIYKVFDINGVTYYSEEYFNLSFLPYKAIRVETFLNKYATGWLIGYINDSDIAKKLYKKIEEKLISSDDIVAIINFYEENILPLKEDNDYIHEYQYLKEVDLDSENHKELKRVYSNL